MRQHTTASIEIRTALETDAEAVSEVLRRAFAEYEPLYTRAGFAVTTPGPDRIRQRMQEGPVWIAVEQGRVIGTVSAVLQPNGCYIRGMAVLPDSRAKGLGRLLLATAESFAREHGMDRLHLSTTPFLGRAIRLYTAFGFERGSDGDLLGTPMFNMTKMLSCPNFATQS